MSTTCPARSVKYTQLGTVLASRGWSGFAPTGLVGVIITPYRPGASVSSAMVAVPDPAEWNPIGIRLPSVGLGPQSRPYGSRGGFVLRWATNWPALWNVSLRCSRPFEMLAAVMWGPVAREVAAVGGGVRNAVVLGKGGCREGDRAHHGCRDCAERARRPPPPAVGGAPRAGDRRRTVRSR